MQIDLGIVIGLFILALYGVLSFRMGVKSGIRVFGDVMVKMKIFRSSDEMYLKVFEHFEESNPKK